MWNIQGDQKHVLQDSPPQASHNRHTAKHMGKFNYLGAALYTKIRNQLRKEKKNIKAQ